MKKVIFAILALLMVLTFVSSCAENKGSVYKLEEMGYYVSADDDTLIRWKVIGEQSYYIWQPDETFPISWLQRRTYDNTTKLYYDYHQFTLDETGQSDYIYGVKFSPTGTIYCAPDGTYSILRLELYNMYYSDDLFDTELMISINGTKIVDIKDWEEGMGIDGRYYGASTDKARVDNFSVEEMESGAYVAITVKNSNTGETLGVVEKYIQILKVANESELSKK